MISFLHAAPIILLDEATWALDSDSEFAIQQALMRLIKDRTVVAIAHRLSTREAFDLIVVIDRGRIIGDGALADLLRHDGFFRQIYQRQFSKGHKI